MYSYIFKNVINYELDHIKTEEYILLHEELYSSDEFLEHLKTSKEHVINNVYCYEEIELLERVDGMEFYPISVNHIIEAMCNLYKYNFSLPVHVIHTHEEVMTDTDGKYKFATHKNLVTPLVAERIVTRPVYRLQEEQDK